MTLLIKIAFRNLFRHKGRSLAIGLVVLTGALFMTLGNGVISGMEKGTEKNLVKGRFGDIQIISADRKEDLIVNSFYPMDVIEKFDEIKKTISAQDFVKGYVPQIMGTAAMLDVAMRHDNTNDMTFMAFKGINFETYQNMYGDNIVIVEGEIPQPGEKGLLLNVLQREWIYRNHKVWVLPENGEIVKDHLMPEALANIDNLTTRRDLVLLGTDGTGMGTDVRVPIKGIFKYQQINDTDSRNLIDIETARDCMGYISAAEMDVELSKAHEDLFTSVHENPDGLFSEDDILEAVQPGTIAEIDNALAAPAEKKKAPVNTDIGAYNLVQVNLKDGIPLYKGVDLMNDAFRDANLDRCARAVAWREAIGGLADVADMLHIALTIFVNLIYFSAILMMANTFSMAAIERENEIATMRTIGGKKPFVIRMFITEGFVLSFIFGGCGIIASIAIIKVLAAAEIEGKTSLFHIAFGGNTFCPVLDMQGLITGIIQLAIITVIAMAYPALVAGRIKPIDAMKRV